MAVSSGGNNVISVHDAGAYLWDRHSSGIVINLCCLYKGCGYSLIELGAGDVLSLSVPIEDGREHGLIYWLNDGGDHSSSTSWLRDCLLDVVCAHNGSGVVYSLPRNTQGRVYGTEQGADHSLGLAW